MWENGSVFTQIPGIGSAYARSYVLVIFWALFNIEVPSTRAIFRPSYKQISCTQTNQASRRRKHWKAGESESQQS